MSKHHVARAQSSARRAWRPTVEAGKATCARCGRPILNGQQWDVGHVHDLALGGDPAGPTRPEHARRADCTEGGNRAAGARLGNQARANPRRRLAAWLARERLAWNAYRCWLGIHVECRPGFFPHGSVAQPRVASISPTTPEPFRPRKRQNGAGSPQDLRWSV